MCSLIDVLTGLGLVSIMHCIVRQFFSSSATRILCTGKVARQATFCSSFFSKINRVLKASHFFTKCFKTFFILPNCLLSAWYRYLTQIQ